MFGYAEIIEDKFNESINELSSILLSSTNHTEEPATTVEGSKAAENAISIAAVEEKPDKSLMAVVTGGEVLAIIAVPSVCKAAEKRRSIAVGRSPFMAENITVVLSITVIINSLLVIFTPSVERALTVYLSPTFPLTIPLKSISLFSLLSIINQSGFDKIVNSTSSEP